MSTIEFRRELDREARGRVRSSNSDERTSTLAMRILRYAVAQAMLGILIDGVLLAMAVYSASAQVALAILVLGCILALGFFLIQGWRSVGGGMVLGVGLYVVFTIVWYTLFCSSCGE